MFSWQFQKHYGKPLINSLKKKKKKKLIDWPLHIKYIFNLNTSNNVPKKPSVYHLTQKKKKKKENLSKNISLPLTLSYQV